ncbi:unnamed protein product [Rhodiola kirilowii]
MYEAAGDGSSYSNDVFIAGVNQFVKTAVSNRHLSSDNKMRCPCMKCKNRQFIYIRMLEEHLYKYDFTPNYYNWMLHGEDLAPITYGDPCTDIPGPSTNHTFGNLHDVGNDTNEDEGQDTPTNYCIPDSPNLHCQQYENPEANRFFNLLNSCSEPAYEGCTTETELSINMKMLATKANYGFSEGTFNAICGTMKNMIGGDNKIPASFKQAKKLVSDLGMGYKRIDVCVAGCMIYYSEDESLTNYRICSERRYHRPRCAESSSGYQRRARCEMFYLPIIPRLFLSEAIEAEMSWHARPREDGSRMVHPSDGESWKHFDRCHPHFASEPRNVRLGLCTDGFNPWGM